MRDKKGRFIQGSKINLGRKKPSEELVRRTNTRRNNGFFKNVEKRIECSKRIYKRNPKCPICNCFLSKNNKHSCIEIWDKINTKFRKGELHQYFNNWSSREPYGKIWSKELKEQVKKRDNYQCQKCFKFEKELKRDLCIHHIDYNKNNCSHNNLISLCTSCHAQTNYKREDWVNFFNKLRGFKNG
jgi:hypothetical protein